MRVELGVVLIGDHTDLIHHPVQSLQLRSPAKFTQTVFEFEQRLLDLHQVFSDLVDARADLIAGEQQCIQITETLEVCSDVERLRRGDVWEHGQEQRLDRE